MLSDNLNLKDAHFVKISNLTRSLKKISNLQI